MPSSAGFMGGQQLDWMQQLMQGKGYMPQYLAGRDLLGKERVQGEKRLGQLAAGRGTFGQGPHMAMNKRLEGDYLGSLSSFLAQLLGGQSSQQMQLIHLLNSMYQGQEGRRTQRYAADRQADAMKGSWTEALGPLGDIISLLPGVGG
jgi:hypothetical protein